MVKHYLKGKEPPLKDRLRSWVLTGMLQYDYEMIELLAIADEHKRKGTCPLDFQEYLLPLQPAR